MPKNREITNPTAAAMIMIMEIASMPFRLPACISRNTEVGSTSVLMRVEPANTRIGPNSPSDLAQAKVECGDLIHAAENGIFQWEQAVELGRVVAGQYTGRQNPGDITLFESQGVAIWDIAAAVRIYEKALEQGLGQKLPF